MSSPERPRNIMKKAVSLPIPFAMAATIAVIGCAEKYDIRFPPCSLDPRTKTADAKLEYVENSYEPPARAEVDGITFRASANGGVDVFPNQPGRINVIEPNEIYSFQGTDGRTYVITIDRNFKRLGGYGIKNATVVGTCSTTPNATP